MVMKQNKIKKLKTLSETKFLKFYEAEYENKLGNMKTWTIASRKNEDVLNDRFFKGKEDCDDAVVVVALHKPSNKLVIIKQFRIPINSYVYELTAGLIDPGEDAKMTIERELMEETGLKVVEVIKVINKLYLSPGMTDESVMMAYCTCEGEINDKNLEDDECIEAMLISQEESRKLLERNEKMDAKCFTILQSYALLGEKLFTE
ncbi:ADP-ribose pyrophosphatase [Clostridium saccharobutylicum]|uniref:NUDIX hydrolase n=3 Tax=Clostridium saccharobutylicum TaxID=169679 RepID=U5MV90_CLOSA|nr:NUDIX hydrolase [Clostridium saccharobutylicum DSM 13864]AQR90859.1 ADP-ribose pyrophosphatase [Clostridium saccharobutylicum]AQS00763.1 ADP-ribose pyrophosphatase [Clostridium saccharobutylicum]AQS10425.1 ADP-ribose pyrophosphatase [Clostridium saccharobutylicum]AQS14746.1 ADP-ribose pyrophosphatase [Clostridium saccharobutylicum]